MENEDWQENGKQRLNFSPMSAFSSVNKSYKTPSLGDSSNTKMEAKMHNQILANRF